MMKPSKAIKYLLFLLCLIVGMLSTSYAAMNDYCVMPPFVVAGVKPNLLLMLDNSGSQYDLEYLDKSATSTFCYDNTYNKSNVCSTTTTTNCTSDANCPSGEKCVNQYPGYFDPNKFYTSAGVSYTTDITAGNNTFSSFIETASLPAGCTYNTNYLCIDITTTHQTVTNPGTCKKTGAGKCVYTDCSCYSNGDCLGNGNSCQGTTTTTTDVYDVSRFAASGKFLNWLSTSKMDIQKQILTGGKYDSTNGLLIAESRGCVGSRFVKEVPIADWAPAQATSPVSFGIRGDISSDTRLPSMGGTTRIDIFKGDFANSTCAAAVNCWATCGSTCGNCKNATDSCLSMSNTSGDSATWNHALQTCWTCAHQPCCPEDILTGDITRIWTTNECGDATFDYTGLSPTQPRYVCFNDISAGAPDSTTFAGCSMNNYSGEVGLPGKYIGICNSLTGTAKETCTKYQFAYYCKGLQVGEVIDPSAGPADTSNTGNIPANLIDGGIAASLGRPIRTFHVRVSSSAPTGLIQQFQNQIRFGAMDFNTYGSKAPLECNNPDSRIIYSCNYAANEDGGRVIAYVGTGKCSATTGISCTADVDCPSGEQCVQQVGDHSTTGTLISQIDGIRASTWTPFSEGLYNAIGYFAQRTDLRINSSAGNEDFLIDASHNPVQYKCQKNNVLLITDGMSTADLNASVYGLANGSGCGGSCNITGQVDTDINPDVNYAGSRNLADLAAIAQQRKISDFSQTPVDQKDKIYTHVVFSGVSNRKPGEADPQTLMIDTASYGGGTYQGASSAYQLQTALSQAFQTIAVGASSGTAASVLATGEGSGANLVQAIFYPEKTVGGKVVNWTSSLKNMWYFIDPRLGNSSIREDTVQDKILNLQDDSIVHFWFDPVDNFTKAKLFSDSNGDGVADSATPYSTVYFENVKNIWEAGAKLWAESPGDRTIFTTTDGHTSTAFETPLSDSSPLISLLQAGTNRPLAERIINYVRGTDYNAKFCSSSVATSCSTDSDCPGSETCTQFRNRTVSISGISNTLKLGDIINSTPRIASWVPLNTYYDTYKDVTYKDFTETSTYKNRGTVFVGGNDGLLHAFKLGQLALFNEKYRKAQITGTDLGKEQWAYVPKNVLPYLKYLADPGYCHLYYVDATPYLFDASVNPPAGCSGDYSTCTKKAESWKTILIGSMRFGGACKSPAAGCTKDINGDGIINNLDCVHTPATDNGYSSYFALDITEPTNPQVLWEFSHPDLGFSTTGAAIVRIGDKTKNGKWFAVIGSGPTGPIDTSTHQMVGHSDQNLKVFILDLKGPASGTWTLNTDYWVKDSLIQNAFSGSMTNATIDLEQNDPASASNYQDDALYFGFVKAENGPPFSTTKWNVGGVLRLLTKDDLNPNNWALNTVIRDVGPVQSAVAKLQNYATNKLFLFFGTGRYYFKIADQIDDANSGRSLYGVKEPCYSSDGLDTTCTSLVTRSSLGNADSGGVTDGDGWFIDLDTCTNLSGTAVSCTSSSAVFKAERNVTDPLATSIGAVFFTTTKPTADVCEFGGASHLWAIQYDTGGAVSSSKLRGKALMQVSTGSIEEVDLKTAFSGAQSRGGRRSAFVQGVPPAGTPPGIILPAKPLKKVIHIRER